MIGYLSHNHELVQAFRVHRSRGTAGGGAGPSSGIFKSAVKLSELFSAGETVAVRGSLDRPISGIVMDSRRVAPGNLFFAANGDLYFTDQGQTGLHDPTGRVYRLRGDGRLDLLIATVPSPNGLVTNLAENQLYVAVTRANAVWRRYCSGVPPNSQPLRMPKMSP